MHVQHTVRGKVRGEFSRLSRREGFVTCQRREARSFRRTRAPLTHITSVGRTLPRSKMDVVKETLNVAGLLTNVYAPRDLRDKRSSEPIVVLFFLHGRGSSAEAVDPTPRAAFAWVAEKQASSKQSPRDFIVVTFVRWFWFSQGSRCPRQI